MKRYGIILLVFMLILSASFNFYQSREMKRAEAQLTIVNSRVLDNIEQYTRWSIRFIQEIQEEKESGNADDFMYETLFGHLRNSLDDLEEYFAYFVDLQDKAEVEKSVCGQTLESIRSIRNVVNHNLQEKFILNKNQFTANDFVFLQDLQEELEAFLTNIYGIAEANEDQLVINIPPEEEENLQQISKSFVDLGSRYRHSILIKDEDELLSQEEAETRLMEIADNWVDIGSVEEIEIDGIEYRNGVAHYVLETEELLLWLDAKVGTLGYLEFYPNESADQKVNTQQVKAANKDREIPRYKAMDIAEDFYFKFQGATFDDLVKESFTFTSERTGERVYAFRFTPMNKGLRLSSDAFEINVGAESGEVLRYRNRFNETSVPINANDNFAVLEFSDEDEKALPLSSEEIQEIHEETFPDMKYQGRAVIRNYYTEYNPRVVKVFFKELDGQRAALYFDEYTGQELERIYYPFEPF